MTIAFRFNLQKAMQAVAFLLEQIGPLDKIKLVKLIYLADREHFIEHGLPITGDRQFAMPRGPVPSGTLDALNGLVPDAQGSVFSYIHIADNQVTLRQSPGRALLTAPELSTLERVARTHGAKETWQLVDETHRLPEYIESYVEGTSRPIPYERIAKASGNPARFREGRPVITPEMAAQMPCPLEPDPDL
ncbi:MAG TPA: Panacea domain-containing protein [Tepidisphaeraceae bacterium]|nr:Panacea domain-containing protein [Tepidisphaeraceae bacterium]